MSHTSHPHDSTAARGPAAWLDSGVALGLIVVDSNRPAITATGAARGLRKQSGAAHH